MTQVIRIPEDLSENLLIGMTVISKGRDDEGSFIVLDNEKISRSISAKRSTWNRNSIRDELYRLIRDHTELREPVQDTTQLFIGSEIDPLDKVGLIMNIEDIFDIEIPDEDATVEMNTVGDSVEYLCKRVM